MNPWELFGLDAETDTRSVKRRYAQLLKQYRPDEDAEAFQRLREAYEYALAWVEREVHEHEPEAVFEADTQPQPTTPEPFGSGQPAFAPLAETEPQGAEQVWVRSLPDTCDSLDDALAQARQAQLEPALQLELLRRCQEPGDEAIETLRWAMDRLNWLSPWQADYLPPAPLDAVAMRLLARELRQMQHALQAGEERTVLEAATALVASDWMQALDRRVYLQEGLVRLLESSERWSPALFERLAALFGWSEEEGELPCSFDRWEALCEHCERHAVGLRLQQHLSERRPLNEEQRAAWLLLKPLEERKCRQFVDRFTLYDWSACEALEELLHTRYPDLPGQLGLGVREDWRRWMPRKWSLPATVYAWLLLLVTMYADVQYSAGAFSAGFDALTAPTLKEFMASLGIIAVLACVVGIWTWFARLLTALDVPLSRFLLPASWCGGGGGVLLLRHGVPAAVLALLVAVFAPDALDSRAAFAAAFVLQLLFLGLVGSGRSPWPRVKLSSFGLFRIDYSKKAEW